MAQKMKIVYKIKDCITISSQGFPTKITLHFYAICCGPGSVVSIVTGYGLDSPGIAFPHTPLCMAIVKYTAPTEKHFMCYSDRMGSLRQ